MWIKESLVIWMLGIVAVACAGLRSSGLSAPRDGSNGCSAVSKLEPPTFPNAYKMSYNFTLPYVHVLQSNGLSYPVTVWIDKDKGRMRMDTYDGLDSVLYTESRCLWKLRMGLQKTEYVTTPMMDEVVCIAYDPDQVIRSLPDAAQGLLQQQALPDMTEWKLAGSHMRADGRCADVWAKTEKDGGKVNQYRFEIARDDGAPLHLHMHGYDLFSGAHFDEYTADFWEYQAGLQDDSALEPTEMCKKHSMDPPLRGSGANSLALQMSMLLPWAMRGDSAFQEFAKSHARQHSSLQEYTWRRSVFHRNRLFIEQFNEQQLAGSGGAGGGSEPLLLGLNQYADWTEDEYRQLLGFRRAHAAAVPRRQPGSYWRSLDQMPARLPSTVDWRGTGADGLVTDQATCGSCWAFSAAAAMESAWWMATGEVLKLSEQQLMDCSWPYFNGACQGGEPFAAIQYVADHGGAVLEADYQYMGEDGFCRVMANSSRKDLDQDLPRAAFFQGYETIPDRSDVALQKAVLYHGPVSISINASPTTFRFYSSGVLDDPTCTGGRDELDHAVLAIGYGTTADGVDYWIVKNSWSQHWGDQGYVLVKRGENDCGVTTEPILPVVAESSRMAEQAALVEA